MLYIIKSQKIFDLFLISVYVCVSACIQTSCVQVEEGVGSHGGRVTGGCETLDMGAGDRIQVL